jgi:hypothetical protein
MTDEELGRAMYAAGCNAAKAKSKPWTAWERLTPEKQAALIRVAVRARDEYAAAGDAPSYGGFG